MSERLRTGDLHREVSLSSDCQNLSRLTEEFHDKLSVWWLVAQLRLVRFYSWGGHSSPAYV
ncbi:hypothetical protein N8640_03790, partial [Akkermansiaceae bacterium]|nr:hypothetical protein [Akkermansiaceae bacterium]